MKPVKIYFSFPVLLTDRENLYRSLNTKINKIHPNATLPYMWRSNKAYTNGEVIDCDIFIFKPSFNQWSFNIESLPSGVKNELIKARALNKKIYMAYTTVEGEENMYKIQIKDGLICGIPGSSSDIYTDIGFLCSSSTSVAKNIIIEETTSYDLRLLL